MLTLKIIRSREDADTVAAMLDEQLQDGQSVSINLIDITKVDDMFTAIGQTARYSGKYTPCEFADFVLYPERKRVNDWIRTYAL